MSFLFWSTDKISFDQYTLILPSISVGNVGQLAVDLLLQNLSATNVAYINHPAFLPIAGADPFQHQNLKLATSCQLYACQEKNLVIIQHRSPLVSRKIADYRAFLINFIKEHKIRRTILLSSSFSQYFTIDELEGVPMHYLCANAKDEEENALKALSWKQFSLLSKLDPSETSTIPGAGIAKKFLEDCQKEGVPLFVLILVCSEGNNYPDAFQTVKSLNSWLNLKEDNSENQPWKMPVSWTSPFGNDAPITIY